MFTHRGSRLQWIAELVWNIAQMLTREQHTYPTWQQRSDNAKLSQHLRRGKERGDRERDRERGEEGEKEGGREGERGVRERLGDKRESQKRRRRTGSLSNLPATETMLYFSMNLYSGPI